mmetsp:Transcript_15554/g.59014  ORF Transcript_15554/g.59014 Transcript_15554/m.59014 type:complete len:321 (+) Transcript_15554:57-1019(+)
MPVLVNGSATESLRCGKVAPCVTRAASWSEAGRPSRCPTARSLSACRDSTGTSWAWWEPARESRLLSLRCPGGCLLEAPAASGGPVRSRLVASAAARACLCSARPSSSMAFASVLTTCSPALPSDSWLVAPSSLCSGMGRVMSRRGLATPPPLPMPESTSPSSGCCTLADAAAPAAPGLQRGRIAPSGMMTVPWSGRCDPPSVSTPITTFGWGSRPTCSIIAPYLARFRLASCSWCRCCRRSATSVASSAASLMPRSRAHPQIQPTANAPKLPKSHALATSFTSTSDTLLSRITARAKPPKASQALMAAFPRRTWVIHRM